MLYIFLTALATGFSGSMMPGSLLTYTLKQSLSEGPRSGFIITAGHALLELVLVVLIFIGFDVVLKSDAAQIVIGIVGGLLLIYMGADMIIKAAKNKVSINSGETGKSGGNMFISGIVISAMNPYFLLWWAAIGLGFIMNAYNTMGVIGVGIYYIGHISADFIWYGAISIIVGTTRKFINEKLYRILIGVLGALLIFFGGNFAVNALLKLI